MTFDPRDLLKMPMTEFDDKAVKKKKPKAIRQGRGKSAQEQKYKTLRRKKLIRS